jgi:asparagine synthetase B (glutamine-hydrolysing)
VNVDIDASADQELRIAEDGSVSLLAGDPLITVDNDGNAHGQSKGLDLLDKSLKREDWSTLQSARGVFCAAHYELKTGKLYLVSDKLSIRPLYYWVDEHFVIFATALRILESLDTVSKNIDLRGVTELCGLGYPLGTRTAYAGISLLDAAEVVRFDDNGITRHRYWSWDEIGPSSSSEEDQLSELYSSFTQAVSLRNANDTTTVAYLSGGLDSRCVLSTLLGLGVRVHTFNFALPGTQDYLLGNEFASRAGTFHEALPKENGDLTPDYSSIMARAWRVSRHREAQPADRSSFAWSGEGGSVALGHVHVSNEIVGLMREGKTDEAIEAFLRQEQASVTSRLLQPRVRAQLKSVLHDGIREELDNLHCADPARSFYLFLMLNDQRRKLASHFENIDLHRLELQLPFFDSDFLSIVVSLPIEMCLRHKFYVTWLKLFSPVTTAIAWQSYPGHVPCPLPVTQPAAYQWDATYQNEQETARKAKLLEQAGQMLRAVDFPFGLLRKHYLRIAALTYKFGLRDYSYVIEAAWKYYSYWRLSENNYTVTARMRSAIAPTVDSHSKRFNSDSELTSSAVK